MRNEPMRLHAIRALGAAAVLLSGISARANLLNNAEFESAINNPPGGDSGGVLTLNGNWNWTGGVEQVWWAAETGSSGMAFKGWAPAVNFGGLSQHLPAGTNYAYTFEFRANVEAQYTTAATEIGLRFLDAPATTVLGESFRDIRSEFAINAWKTYYISLSAPLGAATVWPMARFSGAADQGFGAQSLKIDNLLLWDRKLSFLPTEIVEPFAYTSSLAVAGQSGGFGFTDAWTEQSAANGPFTIAASSFAQVPGFPKHTGNKAVLTPVAAKTNGIVRHFTPVTNGVIYAVFTMNFEFGENPNGTDQKFTGMSFMSNATELAFFGEVAQVTSNHGIASYGAGADKPSTFRLNPGFGNDYIVFGKYDFLRRELKSKAYNLSDSIPWNEPEWGVTGSVPAGRMESINGVRLAAGASLGTPGACYFDEVRIARRWSDLLTNTAPFATSLVVNGGAPVTDQGVLNGTFPVVMHIRDNSGVEATNTDIANGWHRPNFDIVAPYSLTEILTNETFDSYAHIDSGRTLIVTDTVHVGTALANVEIGTYSIRWSAISSNILGVRDSVVLSNGTAATFDVVDDDAAHIALSAFRAQSVSGNPISDQDILKGTYSITGFVQDVDSGVNENGADIIGPDLSPNYDIINAAGNPIIADQLFPVRPADGAARLSPEAVAVGPSMPLPGTGGGSVNTVDLGTYTVTLSIEDNDNDRLFDSMIRLNETGTTFSVIDDDSLHPYADDLRIGGVTAGSATVTDGQLTNGIAISAQLLDATAGVNVTNAAGGWWLPNMDILRPGDGAQVVSDSPFDSYSGPSTLNGTYTNVFAVNFGVTVPPASIVLGVYTVRWSGLDRDDDRSSDNMNVIDVPVSNGTVFTVTDDDASAPIATNMRVVRLLGSLPMTDGDLRAGNWSVFFDVFEASDIYIGAPTGPRWPPGCAVIDPDGVTVLSAVPLFYSAKGGGSYELFQPTVPAVAVPKTGTWQIVYSAQDQDLDRTSAIDYSEVIDSSTVTAKSNKFFVVDDDLLPPTSPGAVSVGPAAWTNLNNFLVTWTPSDDASGVAEHRYSLLAAKPTLLTDGTLMPFTVTGGLGAVQLDNSGFEVGGNTLQPPWAWPYNSAATICNPGGLSTNGWADASAWDIYQCWSPACDNNGVCCGPCPEKPTSWTSTQAHTGTNSMMFYLHGDAGRFGPGYAAIMKEVTVGVTSFTREIRFSGWFKGNLNYGTSPDKPTAYLAMEFLTAGGGVDGGKANLWPADGPTPLLGVDAEDWTNITLVATTKLTTAKVRFLIGVHAKWSASRVTSYWDDVSADILYATGSLHAARFTNMVEGTKTNWLFTVDGDDDRANDALMSPVTSFVTRLDLTPPAQMQITNLLSGPTPGQELRVQWQPLVDGGGANLSPWRSYLVFFTPSNRDANLSDPFVDIALNSSLGNVATNEAIISNLTFGMEYHVTVAGQDMAGNIGPLTSSRVFRLAYFEVTQGVKRLDINGAPISVDISWKAQMNQAGTQVINPYDLIYVDAASYADALTNSWQWIRTVTNSYCEDTGTVTRTPPMLLTNLMRFYRAAPAGQWSTAMPQRVGSREVYVMKNITLTNGHNFVSLLMVPDTNTIRDIIGTTLPANGNLTLSSQIHWYKTATNAVVTNIVALDGVTKQWMFLQPPAGGNADLKPLPLSQGFDIVIPAGAPTPQYVMVLGRVPTNTQDVLIKGNKSFNVVSFNVPRRVRVDELGLVQSGFLGSNLSSKSDELRVLYKGIGAMGSPRLRIWYYTNNATWRNYLTGSIANGEIIEPDEAIIIYRRATNDFMWHQNTIYTPPGPFINP